MAPCKHSTVFFSLPSPSYKIRSDPVNLPEGKNSCFLRSLTSRPSQPPAPTYSMMTMPWLLLCMFKFYSIITWFTFSLPQWSECKSSHLHKMQMRRFTFMFSVVDKLVFMFSVGSFILIKLLWFYFFYAACLYETKAFEIQIMACLCL